MQAHVVLRDGVAVDADCIKTLQDQVKATIAPYKYPRSINLYRRPPKDANRKTAAF